MKKLGFIGLGNMGQPMAANLVRAGYPLTVHDLRPEPVKALVAAGATAASSPREVAERSDIVITMLTSSPHVEQVMFGPDGVLATKDKISDFEQKLPGYFLRVHRSFIVNTRQITGFSAQDVEIGTHQIPIGVSYRQAVMAVLQA